MNDAQAPNGCECVGECAVARFFDEVMEVVNASQDDYNNEAMVMFIDATERYQNEHKEGEPAPNWTEAKNKTLRYHCYYGTASSALFI